MLPLLLLLTACPRPGLPTLPSPRPVVRYEVTVAVGQGVVRSAAAYDLELRRVGPGAVFEVTTLASRASWEEFTPAGEVETLQFDSEAPRGTDPWPAAIQHAIAGTPTAVRFNPDGRPGDLLDAETWRAEARRAVEALDLPGQASSTVEALLDPERVLGDLARVFPGQPVFTGSETGASWVRSEPLAGASMIREETCSRTEERAVVTWRCEGLLLAPESAGVLVHDGLSTTRLVVDGRGLRELETTYSGTLVSLSPTGDDVEDRAIGGRRLVLRR